jgi:hypothetical protein
LEYALSDDSIPIRRNKLLISRNKAFIDTRRRDDLRLAGVRAGGDSRARSGLAYAAVPVRGGSIGEMTR